MYSFYFLKKKKIFLKNKYTIYIIYKKEKK